MDVVNKQRSYSVCENGPFDVLVDAKFACDVLPPKEIRAPYTCDLLLSQQETGRKMTVFLVAYKKRVRVKINNSSIMKSILHIRKYMVIVCFIFHFFAVTILIIVTIITIIIIIIVYTIHSLKIREITSRSLKHFPFSVSYCLGETRSHQSSNSQTAMFDFTV